MVQRAAMLGMTRAVDFAGRADITTDTGYECVRSGGT